jgi:hypothetical protein
MTWYHTFYSHFELETTLFYWISIRSRKLISNFINLSVHKQLRRPTVQTKLKNTNSNASLKNLNTFPSMLVYFNKRRMFHCTKVKPCLCDESKIQIWSFINWNNIQRPTHLSHICLKLKLSIFRHKLIFCLFSFLVQSHIAKYKDIDIMIPTVISS